jgi:hypothetical protein
MTLDVRAWGLHDAVFELARELGLRSFRVESKVGREGETIISLVLSRNHRDAPTERETSRPARDGGES